MFLFYKIIFKNVKALKKILHIMLTRLFFFPLKSGRHLYKCRKKERGTAYQVLEGLSSGSYLLPRCHNVILLTV